MSSLLSLCNLNKLAIIGDLANKYKTMTETRIHDVNLSIKSTLNFVTE